MRKLVVLAILLAVAVVGDLVAKGRSESEIESVVTSRVGGVGSVAAEIDSFPFTARLLAAGQVSTLRLDLGDVVGRGLDVSRLQVVATDIRLDRDVLVGSGDVRITDVGQVRAEARITEQEVRRRTGAELELLADGRVGVTAAGVTATARAELAEGELRLTSAGLSLAFPLPFAETGLLPCEPDVRVVEDALEASCEADHLPEIVRDAVGAAAG